MVTFERGKYVVEIPARFYDFVEDASKNLLILLTYHVMLYSKDGRSSNVSVAVEQSIYLVLGLAIYWFIYDKLILLKSI